MNIIYNTMPADYTTDMAHSHYLSVVEKKSSPGKEINVDEPISLEKPITLDDFYNKAKKLEKKELEKLYLIYGNKNIGKFNYIEKIENGYNVVTTTSWPKGINIITKNLVLTKNPIIDEQPPSGKTVEVKESKHPRWNRLMQTMGLKGKKSKGGKPKSRRTKKYRR